MAALSWLALALESTESSAVPTCSHSKNDPVGTDLRGESLVDKGAARFVPTVPTVPTKKEGIPIFSAERKRLFSANDPTPDLTPRYGWLVHFTDRDPVYATYSPEATHSEVLRGYPSAVAAEPADGAPSVEPAAPKEPVTIDDRITCRQCQNFTYSGSCTVARPGGQVSAQKGYRPAGADMPHRCNGFEPKPMKPPVSLPRNEKQ
jgi:hypothetical protein